MCETQILISFHDVLFYLRSLKHWQSQMQPGRLLNTTRLTFMAPSKLLPSLLYHLEYPFIRLHKQSPTFLALWNSFVEDNFSRDQVAGSGGGERWEGGGGFGMIQTHYFYCAFYFYYFITSDPPEIIRH